MFKDKNIWMFIGIVILIVGSNYFVYKTITQDYNQKTDKAISNLEERDDANRQLLLDLIQEERKYSAAQRQLLENKSVENMKKLQEYLDEEARRLNLNIQSQLKTIKSQSEKEIGGIREEIGGLEGKISNLRVRSSDFTSVIDDAIRAVMSVRTDKSQGSGVVFDKRGYLITNKHVIEGAEQLALIDYQSNIYRAKLVGTAPTADLAVLKIESDKTFDTLDFARSSPQVGQRIIAVGNPRGLSFTVTEGIVSAVDRRIDDTSVGYIQTDVSINPGSSGGPLVDSDGKIVGINTAKLIDSEGLGFAIPASVAKQITSQALN